MGMPLLIQPVMASLAGDRLSVQLAREPDGKVADVDHLLHFALAFNRTLSHFQRNQKA